jgi:WD40 repeat protein
MAAPRSGALGAAPPGYELLGELGRGGMGVVYQARQQGLNRVVALKMILSADHAGADEVARFRTEAEAIARLQHSNIVQIFEIGEHDGKPFFSLEFCGGGSLASKLGAAPPTPREAAELVEKLALAMEAAHDADVIHRDLKPANVLLSADGTPKITDFGLAKKLDLADGRTRTGAVMGTPSYMAPEQAEGRKDIGPAADIYGLGAILYELLTGEPPFRASTVLDTLLKVIGTEPVAPRLLAPKVPRDLKTICLKCLRKDPAHRYASAADLAADLRLFFDGRAIRARRVGWIEWAWRWAKGHPGTAMLVALVTVSLVYVWVRQYLWVDDLSKDAADALEKLRRQQQQTTVPPRTAQPRPSAPAWRLVHTLTGASGRVWAVAFHPKLNQAASAGEDRWVYLWDVRAGRRLLQLPGHDDTVLGLAFSPDGSRLASAGSDGVVKVWDLASGKEERTLAAHGKAVQAVAFHPRGHLLASASADRTVVLWDSVSWQPVQTLRGHERAVNSVAFSPDGSALASAGDDNTVRIWNVADGTVQHMLAVHNDRVTGVCFDAEGKRLLSVGWDQKALVWDVAAAKPAPKAMAGFSVAGRLNAAAWSPDNRFCVAAGWQNVLVVQGSASLNGHTDQVTALAVSPDSKHLVSASWDRTVRVWELAPQ